ncbi:hypothetical protein Ga0100231_011900 [Opitutaceae bacterium TAV4]|uniref:hypothetical protein n=1 Tax=Geminisphaera colitermitum TaxID=1148786 RepID=UPI000158CC22|nr:hypothetical protein [Geminisphaera colitermitum]RRJ94921.1 hypothetical protein Ga0100231_011900 [Opitutaceae bacterium TAV4]RRJ98913.1 hypothetical protein Ga0100230_011470 [Opitutaceae bacterium TAV3]
MKSKFALIALLTGFVVALAAPALQAQDTGSKPKPAATKSKASPEERRLAQFSKDYNLTPAQQEQTKALLAQQAADLAAVKADTTLDKKAQGQKTRAINATFSKGFTALLTPEQREVKKKLDAERAAKAKAAKEAKEAAGQQ